MKTIVLGAGIIGISTAWHLLERGHEVIVVDRQSDAAQETSFANAAQISVSYCEPWANREAPWKALKWMFDKEAPLLYRPQLDPQQFQQVHRSTIVNLKHLAGTGRDEASRLWLRLRDHAQELSVSRAYVHLFKAM